MAEGIKIEIFKLKNADELTKALADPEARIDTGSAAAMNAALAMALLERAAGHTVKALPGNERADYIFRNAEILRTYMVHLIDEDVKSRGPLRKALQEGDERKIEATRQPAVAIPGEVINMMSQALELGAELAGFCPKDALHYLGESAELSLSAIRAARLFILDMSDKCSDDTYRYIVRRENEITLKACEESAARVIAAAEAAV
jgi:formiminotetrahydrofolate cyclodeaminase